MLIIKYQGSQQEMYEMSKRVRQNAIVISEISKKQAIRINYKRLSICKRGVQSCLANVRQRVKITSKTQINRKKVNLNCIYECEW
jgi:RNase P subunit RPR2